MYSWLTFIGIKIALDYIIIQNVVGFMKKHYALLLAPFLFSACQQYDVEPKITFKPPKYVEELPSKEEEETFGNNGSLFGKGRNPLFTDKKAMYLNDIITVVISEQASASSNAQKKLSQNNNTALGGANGEYFGVNRPNPLLGKLNDIANYNMTTNSATSYAGQGSNTRNEQFTTTLTARVVKVMNNGNYFISGRRELLVNGEKQIMQLSGVISPNNINQKNEINSRFIADARILYTTQGDLKQSTTQGWGTRVAEALWPF